jgi:hypothetical protein
MKVEELEEIFEKDLEDYQSSEHGKFERVVNKFSTRPDLHAFILLDKLVPSTVSIIAGAEHDKIYLETDIEELAKFATKEDIIDLIRCFVNYESDGLYMFA